MTTINIRKDNYLISTEKEKLDIGFIHNFLSTEAYWSLNIPKETVVRSIEHALCFGVYDDNKQIGFARIISDFATVAYLGDVFIVSEYQGKGLSKWLMDSIMSHPDLQGLRRWILLTNDAHGLYEKFGWKELAEAHRWMENTSDKYTISHY